MTTPTPEYRAHVAAHPDVSIMDDAAAAVEAALAMGLIILEGMLVEDDGKPPGQGNLFPIPNYRTDHAQAAELAGFTARETGENQWVATLPDGTARAGNGSITGPLVAVRDLDRPTQPHATTDACLLALRAVRGLG